MATSEPLVPKGLPQGSRQQVRAGMQQAGIPLAPRQQARTPSISPQAPTPGGVLDLLTTPDDFPFLGGEDTGQAPTAPQSVLSGLAASAQSDFARAVIARIAQNLR